MVLVKLEERDKANKNVPAMISTATQTEVQALFKSVGLHAKVYDGPVVSTPSVKFTAFNWNERGEKAALPEARDHVEKELKKFGICIGQRGGYSVEDVHLRNNLLDVKDEKVGVICGGSDIAVVPYKTGSSSINTCICVLFEIKTAENVEKSNSGLKLFEPQAQIQLLASRCLSDQRGVMVVLTDLVSGAILYTVEHVANNGQFNVVEQEVSLDDMGANVATFLTDIAVPDVYYRPVEAHQDPRDISVIAFKKTKLCNDIGLALEHFNDMVDDIEPNSRERALVVDQLFRSMEVPQMSSIVHHCLYA